MKEMRKNAEEINNEGRATQETWKVLVVAIREVDRRFGMEKKYSNNTRKRGQDREIREQKRRSWGALKK